MFRNVGIQQPDAGEIPKRIHTRFKTRRKFEIKVLLYFWTVSQYMSGLRDSLYVRTLPSFKARGQSILCCIPWRPREALNWVPLTSSVTATHSPLFYGSMKSALPAARPFVTVTCCQLSLCCQTRYVEEYFDWLWQCHALYLQFDWLRHFALRYYAVRSVSLLDWKGGVCTTSSKRILPEGYVMFSCYRWLEICYLSLS